MTAAIFETRCIACGREADMPNVAPVGEDGGKRYVAWDICAKCDASIDGETREKLREECGKLAMDLSTWRVE